MFFDARYNILRNDSSFVKLGLFFVNYRNCRFNPSVMFVVYIIFPCFYTGRIWFAPFFFEADNLIRMPGLWAYRRAWTLRVHINNFFTNKLWERLSNAVGSLFLIHRKSLFRFRMLKFLPVTPSISMTFYLRQKKDFTFSSII